MGFSLILRAFFSFPNERQFIECQFFWEFRYKSKNYFKYAHNQAPFLERVFRKILIFS